MNIGSARVDALLHQLVRLTGKGAETAVERAIEERLSRIAPAAVPDRQVALRTFLDRLASMQVRDERQPDEVIGYGPDGLPG